MPPPPQLSEYLDAVVILGEPYSSDHPAGVKRTYTCRHLTSVDTQHHLRWQAACLICQAQLQT
eukprot:scaffold111435_cov20-Tisochrysis_lutea.AAC.1